MSRRPGVHLHSIHRTRGGPISIASRNRRWQFVRSEYDGSWMRKWDDDRAPRQSDYIGHADNLPEYVKRKLCKLTSS